MSKITKDEKMMAADRKKAAQRLRYKPKYCDLLIQHMSKGFSYETFNVKGVFAGESTLNSWLRDYPEFRIAKEQAFKAAQAFYESHGLEGLWSHGKDSPKLNSDIWKFIMKNRFAWADRVETNQNITGTLNHATLMDYIEGKDVKQIEEPIEEAEYEEDEDG